MEAATHSQPGSGPAFTGQGSGSIPKSDDGSGQITWPYTPHKFQMEIHRGRQRFSVIVCHRRFGKSLCSINELLIGAMKNPLQRPRYAYIAPQYKQAKQIIWDYAKFYSSVVPGVKWNESELRVDLPNGGRVMLLGAENPDSIRGIYLDGVVMDEVAQMNPDVWYEVVRPALSDRQGWAMFAGTPRGRNLFYDMYQYALSDPTWFADRKSVV